MSGATSRATSATSRRRRSATPRRTSSRRSTTSSPVSGHVPAPESTASAVDSPEHDWELARDLVRPAFRPVGTQGLADRGHRARRRWPSTRCRATPSRSLDAGPAGLPVVYAIPAGGFDIVVNGDHLLSWGIEPVELQDAAMRNLARLGGDARPGPTRSRASGG